MRHLRLFANLLPRPSTWPARWRWLALALGCALSVAVVKRYVLPKIPSISQRPVLAQTLQLPAAPADAPAPAWLLPAARSTLTILGNPARDRYPDCQFANARNPWDLAEFAGRLYIGLGDAANSGPSPNAGPVPVLTYDPGQQGFIRESMLDEEEIARFVTLDDQLLIPGTDPRQSWDWGNLYRRDAAGHWTQYRTLPRTLHAYALVRRQQQLFAAISITEAVPVGVGRERHGSAVAVSSDNGAHWRLLPLGGWRIFDFLEVGGELYASDVFPGPRIGDWLQREGRADYHAPLYQYDDQAGTFRRRPDLDASRMFPDTPESLGRGAVLDVTVDWQKQGVFIAHFFSAPDQGPMRGLYLARSLAPDAIDIRRLRLPHAGIPWDLRLEDGALEVLHSEPLSDGHWRNRISRTRDGRQWQEILSFEAVTFARSFARIGPDYYVGLGVQNVKGRCAPAEEASGTLLRLRPH